MEKLHVDPPRAHAHGVSLIRAAEPLHADGAVRARLLVVVQVGSAQLEECPGMRVLTERQAFDAMYAFLKAYYERGEPERDLVELLGDLDPTFRDDGGPLDPAQWTDWLAAVDLILTSPR
jgi:hypothetical protein